MKAKEEEIRFRGPQSVKVKILSVLFETASLDFASLAHKAELSQTDLILGLAELYQIAAIEDIVVKGKKVITLTSRFRNSL